MSSQVYMTGKSDCEKWEPNPFKQDKCKNCGCALPDHTEAAVTAADVEAYVAFLNTKQPCNTVLDAAGGQGKLLLGGVAGCGEKNVEKHGIKAIVQCAKGLEGFYPLFGKSIGKMEADGVVVVLRMPWDDVSGQELVDLPAAVRFIHTHRAGGANVLVNCAQGKSRSSSLVIAYLLAAAPDLAPSVDAALTFVRSKRSIAEPNPGFAAQLVKYAASPDLAALKKEFGTAA
eukprot:TRINITY_DN5651_c0_g3_i1.p1 TRINITY_DN5651_c0_g3~~TRINITY_DN5651_c0_g3_i1.p1  ORF type:complete len:230 (+),score=97.19 TRINITY_DN5651_c0_g3_i1:75-764(+)